MEKSLDGVCRGVLRGLNEVYRDSDATALFLAVLKNHIMFDYENVGFEPPSIIETLMSPVYGTLQSTKGKKKKTLVRAYFDRKIEICDHNLELKRMCDEMAEMTDGNFKIYSKGEIRYLY